MGKHLQQLWCCLFWVEFPFVAPAHPRRPQILLSCQLISFHKCLHSDITVVASGKASAFNASLQDAAEEVLQPLHTFPSHCERDPRFSQAELQQSLGISLLICPDTKVFPIFLNTVSSQAPSRLLIMNLFQSINLL